MCALLKSARKNALQVIAEYEGTPAEAVEVPDLSALRQLYSEKNPAVPSLRCGEACLMMFHGRAEGARAQPPERLRTDTYHTAVKNECNVLK